METHQANITVETFASLTTDGVNHGIFVSDADTPIESTTSWQTLIDELIDMYSIPGTNATTIDSIDELVSHMTGLVQASDYFMVKLKSMKVFDRDAWLKANNGAFNNANREDFYKDIEL